MQPISASTDAPTLFANATTSLVLATFSANGSTEPSYITDVKPMFNARLMYSTVSPWSMCTTTGTLALFAISSMTGPITESGMISSCTSACWMMTGTSSSSAAPMTAITDSRFGVLNDPTAQFFASHNSKTSFNVNNMILYLASFVMGTRPFMLSIIHHLSREIYMETFTKL